MYNAAGAAGPPHVPGGHRPHHLQGRGPRRGPVQVTEIVMMMTTMMMMMMTTMMMVVPRCEVERDTQDQPLAVVHTVEILGKHIYNLSISYSLYFIYCTIVFYLNLVISSPGSTIVSAGAGLQLKCSMFLCKVQQWK